MNRVFDNLTRDQLDMYANSRDGTIRELRKKIKKLQEQVDEQEEELKKIR